MATRRLLLFGSSGQIGSALLARLRDRFDIAAPAPEAVDLRDMAAVARVIERVRPSVVVNAAAYTAVDDAESDRESAEQINAAAPQAMAAAAGRAGAALVHFSTDYVFDGTKGAPYAETDAPHPLSVYGATKLAGDQAIERSGIPYLIFRTGWVYSAGGRNFLRTILRRARETGVVRVVNDQVGAPTFAGAIAEACAGVIAQSSVEAVAARSGVYNLTAAGTTSWFGFARAILDDAAIDARLEPVSTAEFGAVAPRPMYSVLDNAKIAETFGIRLPDWRAQLSEVARDRARSR